MNPASEMDPASNYTQRWRERGHLWRHTSEGGFDRRQYEIGPVAELVAKAFVEKHHYAASYGASMQRYGLYHASTLVGVAVLVSPIQEKVLTNVFPDLVPYKESAELGRFVLLDEVPANAETFFLAEAFRQAAALGMRGVVSFSDPLPRRSAGGELVMPGHVGTIYQASNATYLGRATPRSLVMLPDGTVLNDRSRQKVRTHDKGWAYVVDDMVGWGARPLEPGEDGGAWMREATQKIVGKTRVRHRGNHRYAFKLGDRRQRRGVKVKGAPGPYPKVRDH